MKAVVQLPKWMRVWIALKNILWALPILALHVVTNATPSWSTAQDRLLDPEKAFVLSVSYVDERTLRFEYTIAEQYYLYREQFNFQVQAPNQLGVPIFPEAQKKYEEIFAKEVEYYRGKVDIDIPIIRADKRFVITASLQGCSDSGVCYAPVAYQILVSSLAFGGDGQISNLGLTDAVQQNAESFLLPDETQKSFNTNEGWSDLQNQSAKILKNQPWWISLLIFYAFGVGMAFSGCMLPTFPVLLHTLHAHQNSRSSMVTAWVFSLGMVAAYTLLGLSAALIGSGVGVTMQQPWMLIFISSLFVLLALAQWGFLRFQLPQSLTNYLYHLQDKATSSLLGVFALGNLSAVIASACVTAPLTAVLLFVSTSQQPLYGAFALHVLAWGMVTPFILIGIFGKKILSKASNWSRYMSPIFAWLMLLSAWWIVSSLLAAWVHIVLLASILSLVCTYLWMMTEYKNRQWIPLTRALSLIVGLYAVLLWVGLASGGRSVLQPLEHLRQAAQASTPALIQNSSVSFQPINSVIELNRIIQQSNKPVLLNFYAESCVSCKEMEFFTFSDKKVQEKLKNWTLLRADITQNTPAHQQLLRTYNLFGAPGIILIVNGVEKNRIIGFENPENFLQILDQSVG